MAHNYVPDCNPEITVGSRWVATETSVMGGYVAGRVYCVMSVAGPWIYFDHSSICSISDLSKYFAPASALHDRKPSPRDRLKVGTKVRSVRPGHRAHGRLDGIDTVNYVGRLGGSPLFGGNEHDRNSNSQGFTVDKHVFFLLEELDAGDVVIVEDVPKTALRLTAAERNAALDAAFGVTAEKEKTYAEYARLGIARESVTFRVDATTSGLVVPLPNADSLARALFWEEHHDDIALRSEAAYRPQPEHEKHARRVFEIMWEAAGEAERQRYVERAKRLLGGGR